MGKRPKFTSRETSRHGKPVWYFRRYGRRIRLPEQYGTDEWWAAYDAALSGKSIPSSRSANIPARSGSFAYLLGLYLNSRGFNGMAKNTRQQRTAILRDAATKAGDAPPNAVTEQSIRQVMQVKPPYAANNFLKSMRGFYKWAIEMGHVTEDPTRDVKMNKPKSDGWEIWAPEYLKQFRDFWPKGTPQRRVFEIALGTGLRRGDLVRFGWQHINLEENIAKITAEKTGVDCYIPIDNEGWLKFAPIGEDGPILRMTARKLDEMAEDKPREPRPFKSAETLGNWFRKACVKAGIPEGMRLHSLRKTAASLDAENGWTANELMAKYGWLNIKEAELYTKQADRKRLALQAGKK
jgi:integrase